MNKLKLSMEDLSVESFDTTTVRKEKGTVFGEQCTCYTVCTCPGCYTCEGTCPNDHTCADTCWNTCDDFTCLETCGFSNCETRCGAAATCRCPNYQ
jgi:hypothetical protein